MCSSDLAQWFKIRSGKSVCVKGAGYHYENKRYADYWEFDDGNLTVGYRQLGRGEPDEGTGWTGRISDATIREYLPSSPKAAKRKKV